MSKTNSKYVRKRTKIGNLPTYKSLDSIDISMENTENAFIGSNLKPVDR